MRDLKQIMLTTALVGIAGISLVARGQPSTTDDLRVRLVYTGRSLGALGVLRDPDEHELLVEAAARERLAVRMRTFRGWRAGHVTVYSPAGDLSVADLSAVVAGRITFEPAQTRRALTSNNAVLLQLADGRDLLGLLRTNVRANLEFPDLRPADVVVREGRTPDGRTVIGVAETREPWPADPAAWSEGQVNRLEVDGAALDELAVNLGQLGPRATIVQRARDGASPAAPALLVDLGHRDGDLGLDRIDRARLDYTALRSLGYHMVVPYELELALGGTGLADLASRFPQIRLLASNVKARSAKGPPIVSRHIVEIAGVRIGLIGLVDPDLKGLLAKSALADFAFEAPVPAAVREIAALRQEGVQAVIALSNLHPRDNNYVAREVAGVDAIVADLHVRWSPEDIETVVDLPGRPYLRPGSPALVTRSFANGLGVGVLDLSFRRGPDGAPYLARLVHRLESVTDRTAADSALVQRLGNQARAGERPRGDVLVPAFEDLVRARPTLAGFDNVTALGRISKRMWEEFLARLVRNSVHAEVAVLRKLPHFPQAIGALDEADVRAWLWTEDALVTVDLSGADLKAVLADDLAGDLVVTGVNRRAGTINGRRIQDGALYRVATTDLLLEGARFRAFEKARRVARTFSIAPDGALEATKKGRTVQLKTFVLGELARLRDADIARLLDRDPVFEPLVTFAFDRPTVFASFNRTVNNAGYSSVPESRVLAVDSQVIGITGRYLLSHDRRRVGFDMGLVGAYSRQTLKNAVLGRTVIAETADELRLDVTARAKKVADGDSLLQPFLRSIFDTEFTPTRQPGTGRENQRQKVVRFVGGMSRSSPRWPVFDAGLAIEQDLTRQSTEFGVELNAQFRRRFTRLGQVTYRWDTNLSYYLPAKTDDLTDLGTTLRVLQELQIPIVDELSLSIAADVFLFRGKVPQTARAGANALLRVGITYDRLWKPRYQPFF